MSDDGFSAALDQVATWLAACPTWTAIGGTEIISEERDGAPPTTAHAFLSLGDPESFQRVDAETFQGGIPVLIDVLWPPQGLSVAAERRAANASAWGLWAELAAAAGVHVRTCDPSPPIRLGPSDAPAGWWETTITLTFAAGNR